jgi:phage terminase large subunit
VAVATTSPAARSALGWYDQEDGVRVRPVVATSDGPIYSLQPRQLEVWKLTPLVPKRPGVHQAKHIGYGGAAGGGKSHLARAVAAGVALSWPGSVTGLFRSTRPELWRNHISKFLLELPPHMFNYRGQESEIHWINGSRTVLGYLRGERDLPRYQGDEYDCLIFEESTHYSWQVVNWLTSNRLRASGARGSVPFAMYPSNPGGVGHIWFKRWFVDRKFRPDLLENPQDFAFIQAFLHHNEILRRRDPGYEKKLKGQPEPYRSWYLFGDWSKGAGTALPQLDREVHVVPRFDVPKHWKVFGGFDWGFAHPWIFGYYAVSEDGRVFKLDTIRGRRMADGEIIQAIVETSRARGLPFERLMYVAAGRDIFDRRGRDVGYDGETLGERMVQAGLPVIPANNDRIHGLRQLREYLHWRGRTMETGGMVIEDEPYLLFMDTEGNVKCIDTLENMVTNPDRPEDVLKVDADEWGEGGDDDYDETRYALASRPGRSPSLVEEEFVRPWDRSVLEHEKEKLRRVKDRPLEEADEIQRFINFMGG